MSFKKYILSLLILLCLVGTSIYGESLEKEEFDESGRLICRVLFDPDGVPVTALTFDYDGNSETETLWGNLSGDCEEPLLLDSDGLPIPNGIETYVTIRIYEKSLLYAQFEQNGRSIHFTYLPNSSRIDTIVVQFEGEEVVTHHVYDEHGELIEEVSIRSDTGEESEPPFLESLGHTAYVVTREFARASGRGLVTAADKLYTTFQIDYFFGDSTDNALLGDYAYILTGSMAEEHHCGKVGFGDVNEKVRVTHINGILNGVNQVLEAAELLSDVHGGVTIYYAHNSTDGVLWDVIGALAGRFGAKTLTSRHLARTWKRLIKEMGGVYGGGVIVHYGHSLGGSDTYTALRMLTPEERAMIHVTTFGSPKIIPPMGTRSLKNYVSHRDGVGLFGAVLDGTENITWVGSAWGIPLVDHLFQAKTYRELIDHHGNAFIEKYGAVHEREKKDS